MPFKLDDLPPLIELILGGPVPFLLAFLFAALVSRLGRGALGAALGIIAGYLVLHWKLNGALYPGRFQSLAAVRVEHWLFWILPLGALSGLSAANLRGGLALIRPVSLGLGILALCFYPKLRGFWTPGEAALWFALWVAVFGCAWLGYGRFAQRTNQWSALLLSGGAVGIASLVIGLSGSRKLGQMCGALSGAVLGVAALALIAARANAGGDKSTSGEESDRSRSNNLASGAQGPLLAGLLALLVIGYHYNSLDLDQALLCLAPWPLAALLPLRGQKAVPQLLGVGVALLPALIALGLAFARFTQEEAYDY
jgi:hypothetical protein